MLPKVTENITFALLWTLDQHCRTVSNLWRIWNFTHGHVALFKALKACYILSDFKDIQLLHLIVYDYFKPEAVLSIHLTFFSSLSHHLV